MTDDTEIYMCPLCSKVIVPTYSSYCAPCKERRKNHDLQFLEYEKQVNLDYELAYSKLPLWKKFIRWVSESF